jgi:hypothetical protein
VYDVDTFVGADDRKPYTLAEPGIAITADELATLIAAGGDDEVRELLAASQIAEAIAVARFNIAETAYNWDEPRNRPLLPADEADGE